MATFVPSPVSGLSLCQSCWAAVPAGATEEHARWHERTGTA